MSDAFLRPDYPYVVCQGGAEGVGEPRHCQTISGLMAKVMADSNRRFNEIIQYLPDATFAIDLDGKVIAWNLAMEEMTGVPGADMVGKGSFEYAIPLYGYRRPTLLDLVCRPGVAMEATYENLHSQGRSLLAEASISTLKPNGVHLWLKATPLYDSDGRLAGGIESLRDITERKRAAVELAHANELLARKNAALSELMDTLKEHRGQLGQTLLQNVESVILPLLHQLRQGAARQQERIIDAVENSLRDVMSPFLAGLNNEYSSLSRKEMRVCEHIRRGLTTKEIARLECVSSETVKTHRQRIRRKLGIAGKDINLGNFLQQYDRRSQHIAVSA